VIREDVVKLCRLVKSLCPSQVLDQYTPDAWAIVLGHLDYNDAKQAVGSLASLPLEPGKARYIEPGHIIAEVRRIQDRRLADAPVIDPPAGLSEIEYRAWLKETRRQIAAGTYRQPERQIEAGHRPVAELISEATPTIE
jgi:hypothetical protein